VTTPSPDAGAGAFGRNLTLRIASAVVLVPVALAFAYWGGWPFLILCTLCAGGILWEWTGLVTGGPDPRILVPGWAALLAALAFTGVNKPTFAVTAVAIGALVAGIAEARRSPSRPGWAAGGVIYAGLAFLGPVLLRRESDLGLTAFLFLAVTVWMTDIAAYLVGRSVGGPLLWQRVSPKKTWSGAVGGLAGGAVGGTVVAYASGVGGFGVVLVALGLSALSQVGDLFESAVKRRFGAKDTGRLIPGHGGLMDRLDSFVVAALAAVLIGVLHQGTHEPARGLLVWQLQ
jgi:phosphatidate cytidylyltransferase